MKRFLFPLLLFLLLAVPAFSRAGGGCFLPGTEVSTATGTVPIEQLSAGSAVYSFDENGNVLESTVKKVYMVSREGYYIITTKSSSVNVTAEHPFLTPAGYIEAQNLAVGKEVFILSEGELVKEPILSFEYIQNPTVAYNLEVMGEHTFFSNSFAVHNKGGCFLPGTAISTPAGEKSIESLSVGEPVYSFGPSGNIVSSQVSKVFKVHREGYYIVRTASSQVKATAEHPFLTERGYRETQYLSAGETVFLLNNGKLSPAQILSIQYITQPTYAYNLEVSGEHTYFAEGFAVHNKGGGGCFLPGTSVQTPSGTKKIETLKTSDKVSSFDKDGNVLESKVSKIFTVHREGYYSLKTASAEVNATAEHPFLTPEGYIETQYLKAGDTVFILENNKLSPQKIVSIKYVPVPTVAYNLEVDNEHTFFANSFAVHNKGGCFLAGTEISAASGPLIIENLKKGDKVYSFDENGKVKESVVKTVYKVHRDGYFLLKTKSSEVKATAEHPFLTKNGYKEVQELKEGEVIYVLKKGKLFQEKILSIQYIPEPTVAYNLEVDGGHTFFANNFAVHNKGGGYRGGGSSGPPPPVSFYFPIILSAPGWNFSNQSYGIAGLVEEGKQFSGATETKRLSFPSARRALILRSGSSGSTSSVGIATSEPFILRGDGIEWAQLDESKDITFTFDLLELQKEEKLYTTTYSGLTGGWYRARADLSNFSGRPVRVRFSQHTSFSGGWYTLIDNVTVTANNVTAFPLSNGDFERNSSAPVSIYAGTKTSGSTSGGNFIIGSGVFVLMFFIFILFAGAISKLSGGSASGGWATMDQPAPRGKIDEKAERAHRLLNYLHMLWKEWDERKLVQLTRSYFTQLQTAWQDRDYREVEGLMMPDIYTEHTEELEQMIKQKERNELRNLGIEDVKIIIIRNHADKKKNEFVAWISAHAQDVILRDNSVPDWYAAAHGIEKTPQGKIKAVGSGKAGNIVAGRISITVNKKTVVQEEFEQGDENSFGEEKVIRGDDDVYPFEEYWTFLWDAKESKWKIKEITQIRQGSKILSDDNFDELSTPEQMKWYYEHERAV